MTMTNRFWGPQKTGLNFVEEASDEDSEIAYLKPAVGSEYNPLHKNGRRASVSPHFDILKFQGTPNRKANSRSLIFMTDFWKMFQR